MSYQNGTLGKIKHNTIHALYNGREQLVRRRDDIVMEFSFGPPEVVEE